MDSPGAARREEPVQPEVFVSYSWGGDSEALVDEIQCRMADLGVLVTRDKSEIRYRDSIQQFMRRIGAGKCVVVILGKATRDWRPRSRSSGARQASGPAADAASTSGAVAS